jgi:hypothetical protein
MIKIEILKQIVRDDLLHDKIKLTTKIKQRTISQSFYRCIVSGKPSGQSHDKEVVKIIAKHLKIKNKDLYDN